jgi:hypothetical protein
MDAAINKYDQKPKIVSLDLASAMKKATNPKYNEMPRQLNNKSSGSLNQFEKSQIDSSLNIAKPKFDLSK